MEKFDIEAFRAEVDKDALMDAGKYVAGHPEAARLRDEVIKKNRQRGYYEEGE